MRSALDPATQPVDGRPRAVRESSPLCLSATPLEGWSGIRMAVTNTAISTWSCRKRGTEGVDTLKVRDAKDVEQAGRAAIASVQPLEIIGHGSKRLIPHPPAPTPLLHLSSPN